MVVFAVTYIVGAFWEKAPHNRLLLEWQHELVEESDSPHFSSVWIQKYRMKNEKKVVSDDKIPLHNYKARKLIVDFLEKNRNKIANSPPIDLICGPGSKVSYSILVQWKDGEEKTAEKEGMP